MALVAAVVVFFESNRFPQKDNRNEEVHGASSLRRPVERSHGVRGGVRRCRTRSSIVPTTAVEDARPPKKPVTAIPRPPYAWTMP